MKNHIDIVKDITEGMIGIGGIPSNEEFYTEFDMRLKAALNIPVVMPPILHFIDENSNAVDLNAAGVNAKLLRNGTFEYFISYGFAGRKELTPVYGA